MFTFKSLRGMKLSPVHLIIAGAALLLPLIDKNLLILCIVVGLDLLYMRIRLTVGQDIPFDMNFLGMFILSYISGYMFGLIFLSYAFFVRLALGTYSPAHIHKQPILIGLCFMASALSHTVGFVLLGIMLYIIRYAFEYIMMLLITGTISLDRLGFRLTNVLTSTIALFLIAPLLLVIS